MQTAVTTQHVSEGFLLSSSGACNILRPLYQVVEVEQTFGESLTQDLPAEELGSPPLSIYCPEMQCMDRILRHLHDQSLQIGNVRPMQIDRYLAICSLLQNANSYRTTSVESSTRRMTIQCVAGCRHPGGHECVLEKPKTTAFHFDTDLVSKTPSKRIRLQSGRYVTRHVRFGAIIPLEAFVQSEEHTVQYNLLPDLGMFIRAMFLRMYFIPTVKKFTSRISHLASHTERPLSVCEHLTGSICCALIQDSIPCMKRAKRSQKGIEFRQPVGAVEITACINVVLGSLLGIYPRGVKRPIFQARVRLYGRIMTLLHQLPDEKLAFIRNYPFLTKICFMVRFIPKFTLPKHDFRGPPLNLIFGTLNVESKHELIFTSKPTLKYIRNTPSTSSTTTCPANTASSPKWIP
jgi:hypothetical protein